MLDSESVAVGVMSAKLTSAIGVDDEEDVIVVVVFE